ncbi:MAG: hypothetical protein GY861_27660 [bacterium]|nr:hypothetical protein [bacterium]
MVVLLVLILLLFPSSVSALSAVVHVPEKYTETTAGERVYFGVEIKYPENPSRKDLRLSYEILTEEGEVVAQSKVLKAVETQASFMDYLVIPESADSCLCDIVVKISDYDVLQEEVSTSFNISSEDDNKILTYFLILLGVIILVGLLVFFEVYRIKKVKNQI